MNGQEEGTRYGTASTHTALSTVPRAGCISGKTPPWIVESTNPPSGGNTRPVELCLLDAALSIPSTSRGLWDSTMNRTWFLPSRG